MCKPPGRKHGQIARSLGHSLCGSATLDDQMVVLLDGGHRCTSVHRTDAEPRDVESAQERTNTTQRAGCTTQVSDAESIGCPRCLEKAHGHVPKNECSCSRSQE